MAQWMNRTTSFVQTTALWAVATLLVVAGCGTDEPAEWDENHGVAVDGVDEFGKPTLDSTGWQEPTGKADAIQGRPGLPIEVDDAHTAVWEVENAWSDRDTPAAREAGIAWPEDSGLSWEEKFHRWVESFPKIDRDGFGETFLSRTPHGVELPAPTLECAEVSIFLRVAFANWYGLPFFMEAMDANGNRLYFGHFGIRTDDGRYGNMANFRTAYADYSDRAEAIMAGEEEWPSDARLASRGLPGATDDAQPMIGPDAYTGAYFDQVFLNKRVGYYLLMQLVYFGSINLADPVNTYHIEPEATLPGDTLLHRWQRTGIGHVMVVMDVDSFGEGDQMQMEANVASGSMPRRQPLWENTASTKGRFTNQRAGGSGYADYNGGIKRWRIATVVNGQWTNVVSPDDAEVFISSNETERVAQRPDRFDELLTELDPEERLDAMAGAVEQAREHLRLYPASCAARNNREAAFEDLYEIGAEMGLDRADVDARYRELEDYVFAQLVYSESKTCCWLSANTQMFNLIIDYNVERQLAAEEDGMCEEPTVFKAREDEGDGYELFRQYAVDVGQGDQWVDWSPDENCPQLDGWAGDVEEEHDWTPWCELDVDTEPDGPDGPVESERHTFQNDQTMAIPDNDPDGVVSTIEVDVEGTVAAVAVDLFITHTYNGDLLVTLRKDGVSAEVYNGSGPGDDVELTAEFIDGFDGIDAAGTWELEVVDRMAVDEGDLEEWSLHLEVFE